MNSSTLTIKPNLNALPTTIPDVSTTQISFIIEIDNLGITNDQKRDAVVSMYLDKILLPQSPQKPILVKSLDEFKDLNSRFFIKKNEYLKIICDEYPDTLGILMEKRQDIFFISKNVADIKIEIVTDPEILLSDNYDLIF